MFKTTVKISGMMCAHCEARVNDMFVSQMKASKAKSSHEKNETVVISAEPLDENAVKTAVAGLGFTFEGMASEPCSSGLMGFFKK